MNYETIILQSEEGVATITLNRPEKMNAMNEKLADELVTAISEVNQDNTVRAVIITGDGRAFCAGGDVQKLLADAKGPIDLSERARNGAKMVSDR